MTNDLHLLIEELRAQRNVLADHLADAGVQIVKLRKQLQEVLDNKEPKEAS